MSKLRNSPQGQLNRTSSRPEGALKVTPISAPTNASSSTSKNNIPSDIRPIVGQAYTLLRASTGSALLDSFAKKTEPDAFTSHTTLVPSIALRSLQMPRTRSTSMTRLSPLAVPPDGSPSTTPHQSAPHQSAPHQSAPHRPAPHRPAPSQNVRPQQAIPVAQPSADMIAQAKAKQALQTQVAQRTHRPTVAKQADSLAARSLKTPHQLPVTRPAPPALPRPTTQPTNNGPTARATVPSAGIPSAGASYRAVSAGNVSQQGTGRQVKVFGGASYKALQAKAAAGGLVNLDDALLFGGADQDSAQKGHGDQSSRLLESDFIGYLGTSVEDFTASPIKGGLHYTAHLSETSTTERASSEDLSAVLSIDVFKLGDLNAEEIFEPAESRAATLDSVDGETAELVDMSEQITQLNQRIAYLSEKLSELTAIEPFESDEIAARQTVSSASTNGKSSSNGHATSGYRSSQRRRLSVKTPNPVVLDIKTIQLSESIQVIEKRVATLGPAFKVS